MTALRQKRAEGNRRAAMMWMLRECGTSYSEIGRAIDRSPTRVREICNRYERVIARRARTVALNSEPWVRRLRAAGAIP